MPQHCALGYMIEQAEIVKTEHSLEINTHTHTHTQIPFMELTIFHLEQVI